jgi:hypothetical protein
MAVRVSASSQNYSTTLSLGSQAKCSVTCWVKLSADRNAESAVWWLKNSVSDSIGVMTDSGGIVLGAYDNGVFLLSGPAMTIGTWYFVGFVYNAGAATMITRALDATSFSKYTASFFSSSHTMTSLFIQNDQAGGGGGSFLNGSVAAFKGWVGTAMTDAQLQDEAWTHLPRYPAPTFWYPLLKTETADYSGNGYTLTGGTGATVEDGPGVGWGFSRAGLYAPVVTAVTHDLASAGLASSSGTAAANVLYPLASAGLASSSGAAAANILFPLASVGLAAGTGTGILNTLGSIVAGGLASSSGTAAALVGVVLASDGVATSSGLADVQVISGLASEGLAASVGTGSLVAAVTLEASGLAASMAMAETNLDLPLAGAAEAASSGSAAVQVESGLSAAGHATSAGSAGLQAVEALAAAAQAAGTTTGALRATWTLGAVGQATSSGSAEVLVGFVFAGFASSSGSADLSLTITLGTAIGLEATTGDNDLGLEVLIGADARGSSSGRAVLYIALPYIPGPTNAPGRGQGGGTFGPDNRTRAEGRNTGRTRG